MAGSDHFESLPIRLSKSVFKAYQYKVIDLYRGTGIVTEDGCREFMFVRQDNVWLKFHGRMPMRLPPAFSLGKNKRPSRFQCTDNIDCFSIKLQPWVNGYFFPDDVIDGLIDLRTIYGSKVESLHSEIFAAPSFESMVSRVEDFLSNIEMPHPDNYGLTMDICRKIYSSKGTISVKELVKEFSRSRQKINREFLHQTKYSIKEFAISVKISEAIKFKMRNPTASFTELAHRFEYFDQSHFNRDIKRFTNVAPKLLFSGEKFTNRRSKPRT